jgi:hypothetical protein
LNQLSFKQQIQLLSIHIDLIGSVFYEQQRGEFMRTQHRSLHVKLCADCLVGGWPAGRQAQRDPRQDQAGVTTIRTGAQ